MSGSRPNNLEEFKIKASILLKLLRSNDPDKSLTAAIRFQCLPYLAKMSPKDIVLRKDAIKRKGALLVIAMENKQPSWADLKRVTEKREALKANRDFTSLLPKRCAGFANAWYADYDVARGHLEQVGGFLLPYKTQFFLCKDEYIRVLGLDPEDPDWKLIARDWVRPADSDAWRRLNSKLKDLELTHGQ